MVVNYGIELPKFNMAGPVGGNRVQAFSFVLLLRENQPSNPFHLMPQESSSPNQENISSPSNSEFSELKGWAQGGCQQGKPSCNRRM